MTEESFDEQVDANLKGQYFILQKALPLMADGGSIVFTVGVGSRRGIPGATLGAPWGHLGGHRRAAPCRRCCPRSRSNWLRAGSESVP